MMSRGSGSAGLSGWHRLFRVFRKLDADVDTELAFHLDERTADLVARGATAEAARAQAIAEFGDVDSVRGHLGQIDRRIAAQHKRADWWEGIAQDVRYVIRSLGRTPGFTAMVVVTLALGLGANAALFSLLDRLFVQTPVGVHEPFQLRRMYQHYTNRGTERWRARLSVPEVLALRAAQPATTDFTAYASFLDHIGSGASAPEVNVAWTYGNYFSVLGVRSAAGRFFDANESKIENFNAVAVISHALWLSRFGGSDSAVGAPVDIGSHRYTVIGVAPPGFRGIDLDAADVWLPMGTYGSWKNRSANWYASDGMKGTGFLMVVVRPPSEPAERVFEGVATTVFRTGGMVKDTTAKAVLGSIIEARGPIRGQGQETLISTRLAGVALIILLIACANVANLVLARGVRRQRELAVRLALGVSRGRLVMQLTTESLVTSLLAGGVALLVAVWGATGLRAALLPRVRWDSGVLDMRLILFTVVAAVITGLGAGLLPALQATRPDLASALKSGGREGGTRRSRTRTLLLVTQVAFSVVLLVGAGVFVRSLQKVQAIDVGYDTDRILFGSVRYDRELENHSPEIAAKLPEIAERVSKLRGVEHVGLSEMIPLQGFGWTDIFLPGRDSLPKMNNGTSLSFVSRVTPGFFDAVGMKVKAGRGISDADVAGAPKVIVVNESLARTFWPGENPLTKCIIVDKRTYECRPVIGMVNDAHYNGVIEEASMQFYLALAQEAPRVPGAIAIRLAPNAPATVSAEVSRLIQDSFGAWATPRVRPMSGFLADQFRPWLLGATLFSAAGILALVVAAVGVYSNIAYAVSQRMHEMGVRVALGARAKDIVRLVVGEGVRAVLAGVILGAMIALALGKLIAAMLYNTTPRSPGVLGLVAFTLVGVAVIACLAPALRAARADPVNAMRAD